MDGLNLKKGIFRKPPLRMYYGFVEVRQSKRLHVLKNKPKKTDAEETEPTTQALRLTPPPGYRCCTQTRGQQDQSQLDMY